MINKKLNFDEIQANIKIKHSNGVKDNSAACRVISILVVTFIMSYMFGFFFFLLLLIFFLLLLLPVLFFLLLPFFFFLHFFLYPSLLSRSKYLSVRWMTTAPLALMVH